MLFFNAPAPTEFYTLSLHDALPISPDVDHRVTQDVQALDDQLLELEAAVIGSGRDAQRLRDRSRPTRVLSRARGGRDRKSTRLNSSHQIISYAVFCLKKKTNQTYTTPPCFRCCFSTLRRPPSSTLFPYTTLFRSLPTSITG